MAGDLVLWSQVGKWAWDRRDDILGLVKRLTEWIGSPKGADGSDRGILILGAGGVGKTTLARILSGKFDWLLDEPWQYRESAGIERFALKDDPKVQVLVLPGQPRMDRREATWPKVLADLSAGKYRGVILVSAYGYHPLDTQSYKTHPLYTGNKNAFLAAYLDQNRHEELAVIDRLVPHMTASPGKLWLLSVVTKEDLWADDRPAVEAWLAGEYAAKVSVTAAGKGTHHFRHEAVPLALLISNFGSGDAEVLRKNTAGYDHQRWIRSIRRLLEVVDALRAWEGTA